MTALFKWICSIGAVITSSLLLQTCLLPSSPQQVTFDVDPLGHTLIACDDGGECKWLSLDTGNWSQAKFKLCNPVISPSGEIYGISPDGRAVLKTTSGAHPATTITRLPEPKTIMSISLASNGDLFAVISGSTRTPLMGGVAPDKIAIVNLSQDSQRNILTDSPYFAHFSPHSSSKDKLWITVKPYDSPSQAQALSVTSGKRVKAFSWLRGIYGVAVDPRTGELAMLCQTPDFQDQVWIANLDGDRKKLIIADAGRVSQMCLFNGKSTLATSSADSLPGGGSIRLYDASTGKLRREYRFSR